MDRGAWRATLHEVAKSQVQLKLLSMHTCMLSTQQGWEHGQTTLEEGGLIPTPALPLANY